LIFKDLQNEACERRRTRTALQTNNLNCLLSTLNFTREKSTFID